MDFSKRWWSFVKQMPKTLPGELTMARSFAKTLSLGILCAIAFSFVGVFDHAAVYAQKIKPVKSFFGVKFPERSFSKKTETRLLKNLQAAKKAFSDSPNADNFVWFGRRTAYLWRYNEAIDIFTKGVDRFPDDARILRHRAHRYITVRKLDKAIKDLDRAVQLIKGKKDQVEPDGAPNSAGIPISTLHTNVYYHLGLAHYLKGNFDHAFENFDLCRKLSSNDDMMIAASDWTYRSLRRLGKHGQAKKLIEGIPEKLKLIENKSYHRRVQMYQGKIVPEDLLPKDADAHDIATYGYAIGNWYLANGETKKAHRYFKKVTSVKDWSAFGFIAAEAELFRSSKKQP